MRKPRDLVWGFEIGDKLKYRGKVATVQDRWWDNIEARYEVYSARCTWSVSETSLRKENDPKKVR